MVCAGMGLIFLRLQIFSCGLVYLEHIVVVLWQSSFNRFQIPFTVFTSRIMSGCCRFSTDKARAFLLSTLTRIGVASTTSLQRDLYAPITSPPCTTSTVSTGVSPRSFSQDISQVFLPEVWWNQSPNKVVHLPYNGEKFQGSRSTRPKSYDTFV